MKPASSCPGVLAGQEGSFPLGPARAQKDPIAGHLITVDSVRHCPGSSLTTKRCMGSCRFRMPVATSSKNLSNRACKIGLRQCGGITVRRDQHNGCITWLPCPSLFRCKNKQRITRNRVCDGLRNFDGSDEWLPHGCEQGVSIGRRLAVEEQDGPLDQEALAYSLYHEDTSALQVQRRADFIPDSFQPSNYNCYTYDLPENWPSRKKDFCCG